MTDQTPATRMFIRPTNDDGTPAGEWEPLGLADGGFTPFVLPAVADGTALPDLTAPGTATITATFERGPGWDQLIRAVEQLDAIERSKAMVRAVEHHAAVLVIVEDYRTTYIVTDMLEPLHLHTVRAEHLNAVVIGKRS
jgi:hypothetical protein